MALFPCVCELLPAKTTATQTIRLVHKITLQIFAFWLLPSYHSSRNYLLEPTLLRCLGHPKELDTWAPIRIQALLFLKIANVQNLAPLVGVM